MDVVLFHSMFGLRGLERAAAERLRSAGHDVLVPDLFEGATVPGDLDQGFALMERVGWSTIVGRARASLAAVPAHAALAGLSMGVGVIGALWPERSAAAAVFCLHAPTRVPAGVRPGTPVQLHVGGDDVRFAPADQVALFRETAAGCGAVATVHRYPGAGHLFTDPSLPDFDAAASAQTWAHVLQELRVCGGRSSA